MKKEHNFSQKPYSKCLLCEHRGKLCRGRTSDLECEHWFEFMLAMKKITGMSDAKIADATGLSIKTINRIMTLDSAQDPMRETARLIENAILGSADNYPCLLEMDKADLASEAQAFRDTIESIRAEYQATIDMLREQVQFLRTENDRKARIIDRYLEDSQK